MGGRINRAAKGTFSLGLNVIISASYESVSQSCLVGVGVLPLCYRPGDTAESLDLNGSETFDIEVDYSLEPRQDVRVKARKLDGSVGEFNTICRVDTPIEVEYYRNG